MVAFVRQRLRVRLATPLGGMDRRRKCEIVCERFPSTYGCPASFAVIVRTNDGGLTSPAGHRYNC